MTRGKIYKWPPAWWDTPSDRFSFFVALFTAVLAVVATLQTCILSNQLAEMRLEQRPWIGPPIRIDAAVVNDRIDFTLIFKNVGHTPTRAFVIDADIFPTVANGSWYTEAEKFCAKWRDRPDPLNNKLSVIPQGEWPIDLDRVPEALGKVFTLDGLKKINAPYIAGCALYSFDDGRVHETAFGVELTVGDST
jgi:hypothetical protein